MNITLPITYESYSESMYYCHITESGQWICACTSDPIIQGWFMVGVGIMVGVAGCFMLALVVTLWD